MARDEQIKHLRKYTKVDIIEIPEDTKLTPDKSREVNSAKILSKLSPQDLVIVLDERGKDLDSVELAGKVGKWSSRSRPVYVIGGSHGLSEEIKQRANYVLRLSKMTLLHEMAQVLLLEQVYRAYTILKGKDYHK